MLNQTDMYVTLEKRFTIIRWLCIVLATPAMIPFSDYKEDIFYNVLTTVVFGGIYNGLLTYASYNKQGKLVNILKYTSFFDTLLVSAIVFFRGGLRSDTYILYLLVILSSGAKHGIKGIIISLIQTIVFYVPVCYFAELPNQLDWGRLVIHCAYFIFISIMMYEVSRLINESKFKLFKAEQLAQLDPLTKLPNRLLLSEKFEQLRKKHQNNGSQFAIVMIDIDNFKKINDSLGHTFGDKILVGVAQILSNHITQSDFICRFGGEEFLLFIADSDKDAVLQRLKDLKKAICGFHIEDIKITVSIGVSMYDDRHTMIENIAFADKAMYSIKNSGKNKILFYDDYFTENGYEKNREF